MDVWNWCPERAVPLSPSPLPIPDVRWHSISLSHTHTLTHARSGNFYRVCVYPLAYWGWDALVTGLLEVGVMH